MSMQPRVIEIGERPLICVGHALVRHDDPDMTTRFWVGPMLVGELGLAAWCQMGEIREVVIDWNELVRSGGPR